MSSNPNITTRIAPSPTGRMHIGTVRTALFNYLFARHHRGTYVVRIEDTDRERSTPEWTEAIWSDFAWLNLQADASYVQSEHAPRHRELLQKLVEEDRAYISKEMAKDGSGREVEVIRLRNPNRNLTFHDAVHGDISFDTTELGDFVIARSIDDPLYHFAVVVDDADEGVTHVIRGADHISNTPRQILIQEALGFARPEYVHIPLILAPDRSKLSKRKHGASIEHYRDKGFLPEAVTNYIAFLGWNPGTDQELFTLDELVTSFSLEHVQKSPAIFDEQKLLWFNRQYLLKLPDERLLQEARERLPEGLKRCPQYSQERLARIVPILRERISTFGEIAELAEQDELRYYFEAPRYRPEDLSFKQEVPLRDILEHLITVSDALFNIENEQFGAETVKAAIWEYATEVGRGAVLWPLRFALSGKERSPDPFTLSEVLGKEETLSRVATARTLINEALNET